MKKCTNSEDFGKVVLSSASLPLLRLLCVGLCVVLGIAKCFGQTPNERFVKARTKLLQRYDSVEVKALDYPESRIAIAECKRRLQLVRLEESPTASDDTSQLPLDHWDSICIARYVVDLNGVEYRVDPYGFVDKELRSADGKVHYLLIAESDHGENRYECEASSPKPERDFLEIDDRRNGRSYSSFSYLFNLESGQLVDSGGVEVLYDGAFARIVRDGRVNFLDVNKGIMFDWNDPITFSLSDIWVHDTTVRLIRYMNNDDWRIITVDKRSLNQLRFTSIWSSRSYNRSTEKQIQVSYESRGRQRGGSVDIETCDLVAEKTLLLYLSGCQWWYCKGYTNGCISDVQFLYVDNSHPYRHIRGARIMLELADASTKAVLYRKEHWITVGLGPGELTASQVIRLETPLWTDQDINCRAEVLDVW